MTALADIAAIVPTAGSKTKAQNKYCSDQASMWALAKSTAQDLKNIMTILKSMTPQNAIDGGGDDANLASVNSIIAEIA